ncbi:MAG: PD-(D/E)XK nuclease family transposase [Pseudomonadota bacterium]
MNILNPSDLPRCKYDLFAEDTEKRIIVEIQQVKEDEFFDRFLYYHLISMVEQVGGYQEYGFDRTVYTIVVLTSTPRDGSIKFSCAVSDMNPIDEFGDIMLAPFFIRDTQVTDMLLEFKCTESLSEKAVKQALVYDFLYKAYKTDEKQVQSFLLLEQSGLLCSLTNELKWFITGLKGIWLKETI